MAWGRPYVQVHGLSRTPEYSVWVKMIHRCHNPGYSAFPDYGARGIQVCARWRSSVEAFVSDMGRRPSPQHTLERINNDGNYEPSNCRWATRAEQARNKRNNRVVEFQGKSWIVTDLCKHVGIDKGLAHIRMKNGWSVERTFSTPPRRQRLRRLAT